MPAPQWARPGFVGVCPRALRENVRAVSNPNGRANANLFDKKPSDERQNVCGMRNNIIVRA